MPKTRLPANPFKTTRALAAMVRVGDARAIDYLVRALKHCEGNITLMAKKTGFSERSIYNWRDSNDQLRAAFDQHALGRDGAARRAYAESARVRKGKRRAPVVTDTGVLS